MRKDEAALWKDGKTCKILGKWEKQVIYMYDRSRLIFKSDILTNMYIQMHRKSSRRITIKLSTVVTCRVGSGGEGD